MSPSLTASLTAMFGQADVRRISHAAGAPEEHIRLGFRAALALILGGIAGKADDVGELYQLFDLVASEPAADVSEPREFTTAVLHKQFASLLFDKGQRLLSIVFGENQSAVAEEASQRISLPSGVIALLMALAAPIVVSALGRRVHEDGISLESFPGLLLRETGDLSGGPQPVSVNTRHDADPDRPNPRLPRRRWMWVCLIAGVLLTVVWMRGRSPSADKAPVESIADVTRTRTTWPGTGRLVDRDLPGHVHLRIPESGMEAKLLTFIGDSSRDSSREQWFDFDRLTFDTNSAIPRPESEEQLANIASILKAYPQLRLKIGGYTDNKGNRQANQRLSENRAASVQRELAGMGIDRGRLEAEGYGDQHAIADNATEVGRAKNRRISLRVLQK